MNRRRRQRRPPPLLSLRAFVLLVASFGGGTGAGALTWLQCRSLPSALLAGCACFGGALTMLHELVE